MGEMGEALETGLKRKEVYISVLSHCLIAIWVISGLSGWTTNPPAPGDHFFLPLYFY